MCARRFLWLIFWLVVLAVAAGFAIYQFGGRVLTRTMTPTGHFAPPPPRSVPQYSVDAHWLAKPGLANDPSGWLPQGAAPEEKPKPVAVFYVHPTTYLAKDKWNAAADEGGDTAFRDTLFVRSQASAFNGVGEIWAPRYRQAAFGAFLLKTPDAQKALDLAYRDVLAAFDTFLAAQPRRRPIVLAGHSQGGLHLSRLLVDRRDVLRGRLVAAYAAGWPLSVTADLPAMDLPPCTGPGQTGCVISWLTFGEPSNASLILDNWAGTQGLGGSRSQTDLLCVNPITGTRDGAAPPSANPGTLAPTMDLSDATLLPGAVGATCKQGLLIVDGKVPELGGYMLPGNNYHVYDYALFWGAIRADAERRAAAWR